MEFRKSLRKQIESFWRNLRPPEYLATFSIDAVAVRNIGSMTHSIFKSRNINVYGTKARTLSELLDEVKNNSLKEATEEHIEAHHGQHH